MKSSQKTEYTYYTLKRLSKIVRKPNGTTADDCQEVNYYFDTNIIDANFSLNSVGRLSAVIKGTTLCSPGRITEMYSYVSAGGIFKKRLYIDR